MGAGKIDVFRQAGRLLPPEAVDCDAVGKRVRGRMPVRLFIMAALVSSIPAAKRGDNTHSGNINPHSCQLGSSGEFA